MPINLARQSQRPETVGLQCNERSEQIQRYAGRCGVSLVEELEMRRVVESWQSNKVVSMRLVCMEYVNVLP